MKLKEAFGINEAPPSNTLHKGVKPKTYPPFGKRTSVSKGQKEPDEKHSGTVEPDDDETGEDGDENTITGGKEQTFADIARELGLSVGKVAEVDFDVLTKLAKIFIGKGGPFYDAYVSRHGHPMDFKNVKNSGSPAYKEFRDFIRNPHFKSAAKDYLERAGKLGKVAQQVAPLILAPGAELTKELEKELGHPLTPEDIKTISQEPWFLDLIEQEVVKKGHGMPHENRMPSMAEALDEADATVGSMGTASAADPNMQNMKNMLNQKYKTAEEKVQALAMLSKFVLVTPQYRKELAKLLSMN